MARRASPGARSRAIASAVLGALGCLCIVVALVAGYARVAVLDSDQFADRAAAALDDPAVREVVADQLTDQVVLRADRDLVAVRPLVDAAAGAVVGSPPFRALFHAAARDLHRTVFTRSTATATATIADVGVLLAGALEQLDPSAAEQLPRDLSASIDAGRRAAEALDAAQTVDDVGWLALAAAGAALVALVAAVAIAPRRRRAFAHVGIGVAVAGGVVALALWIARGELLAGISLPADEAAAGAVWDAFLGDLATWALVALAAGTIVAAAAASLLRPVELAGPLRRAWTVATTTPAAAPWRAARALALVAAGALIVAERQRVLDAALVLAGLVVLYHGVAELLRMVTLTRAERREAASAGAAPPAGPARPIAPWLAGGAAAVAVALLAGGLVVGGATQPAQPAHAVVGCNGH
ncbi:hypothetical protein [Conexibacter arvalis]|uniref:Integral membrane protein n=1 Tax=Conexibacter arvalis TaxID=912552 RepID=A0A840I8G2_9ACTN|nr:hypothetical protein [Conexibacter arvalis]MBB4660561.1 hypothetical protein [Conexibacter arvalis]